MNNQHSLSLFIWRSSSIVSFCCCCWGWWLSHAWIYLIWNSNRLVSDGRLDSLTTWRTICVCTDAFVQVSRRAILMGFVRLAGWSSASHGLHFLLKKTKRLKRGFEPREQSTMIEFRRRQITNKIWWHSCEDRWLILRMCKSISLEKMKKEKWQQYLIT